MSASPSPSCSVGKHGKRPRNATSASYEHPQVPRANDFRDFVLEMQNTITDLRKQVPAATPLPQHPAFPRVRTDSFLCEHEGVHSANALDPRGSLCLLFSWLGHTESLSFPVAGTLNRGCHCGRVQESWPERPWRSRGERAWEQGPEGGSGLRSCPAATSRMTMNPGAQGGSAGLLGSDHLDAGKGHQELGSELKVCRVLQKKKKKKSPLSSPKELVSASPGCIQIPGRPVPGAEGQTQGGWGCRS